MPRGWGGGGNHLTSTASIKTLALSSFSFWYSSLLVSSPSQMEKGSQPALRASGQEKRRRSYRRHFQWIARGRRSTSPSRGHESISIRTAMGAERVCQGVRRRAASRAQRVPLSSSRPPWDRHGLCDREHGSIGRRLQSILSRPRFEVDTHLSDVVVDHDSLLRCLRRNPLVDVTHATGVA